MDGRSLARLTVVAVGLGQFVLYACAGNGAEEGARNADVRAAIEEAGVDPSSELTYEHFFYFGDEASAQGAETDLVDAGFAVQVLPPGGDIDEWSLLATRTVALDAAELDEVTNEMQAVASRHGGTYDGWGTPLE